MVLPTRKGGQIQKVRMEVTEAGSSAMATGQALRMVWFGPATQRSPRYGEEWAMSGRLERKEGRGGQVTVELLVDKGESRRVAAGRGNRFMALAIQCRQMCRELLTHGIDPGRQETAVILSLLLGYTGDVSRETREWFVNTGTIHIFAISGTHVIIVAAILITVLRWCGVSRTRWHWIVVPFLIFYTFVTGLQISAIRAVTMAALFWLAPCAGRKPDIFSAMGLAAIGILAVAPEQVASPGFILSFAVTLALALGYGGMMQWLMRGQGADPLLEEPEPWWMRGRRWVLRAFASVMVGSILAELTAGPVIAYCFEMVAPIGILANVIMVPLAFAAILVGAVSMVAGLLIPWLGLVANHLNSLLASCMLLSMEGMASVPWGNVEVASPSVTFLVIYYVLWTTVLLVIYQTWRKGRYKQHPDDPLMNP